MKAKEVYCNFLRTTMGEAGEAIIKWLDANTLDDEFYKQPVSIYQQDKLLIVHAINMFKLMGRLEKVLYGQNDASGAWQANPPYTIREMAKVALLHVLGNIGKMRKEKRNRKVDGKWVEVEEWVYNETPPYYGTQGEVALLCLTKALGSEEFRSLGDNVIAAIIHCHEQNDPQMQAVYAKEYSANQLVLLAQIADKAEVFAEPSFTCRREEQEEEEQEEQEETEGVDGGAPDETQRTDTENQEGKEQPEGAAAAESEIVTTDMSKCASTAETQKEDEQTTNIG